jgi:hypothetical protein
MGALNGLEATKIIKNWIRTGEYDDTYVIAYTSFPVNSIKYECE